MLDAQVQCKCRICASSTGRLLEHFGLLCVGGSIGPQYSSGDPVSLFVLPSSATNSANADQSNSVAGAYDDGNAPYTVNVNGITIESDFGTGNAVNDGTISSGNRKSCP